MSVSPIWTAKLVILLCAVSTGSSFSPLHHRPLHVRPLRVSPHTLLNNNYPSISNTRNQSTSISNAISNSDDDSTIPLQSSISSSPTSSSSLPFYKVLWRFTRPHTLIGSAVAVPAIHMLAAPTLSSILSLPLLSSVLKCTLPSLLMNIYVTGLNQITDVEIDKINKPDLPIAAGDLSPSVANAVVVICLISSLLMGTLCQSPGLNLALWGSAILGTMYSLPPVRLKRFPLLAAFCIVAVRGTIINLGFYAHANRFVFQNTDSILTMLRNDPKCYLSSLFFCMFGIVIALMKDVPDVKGDAVAGIRSFSVRVGQRKVFHNVRRLLSGLFGVCGLGFLRIGVAGGMGVNGVCRMALGVLGLYFGFAARQKGKIVDATDQDEVYQYYMYLWKLFYSSYLALPFAR